MEVRGIWKVGIVVKDLEESTKVYTESLGLPAEKGAVYKPLNTTSDLLFAGKTLLQFIQPIGPGSIARFLDKRGEGLQHISFQVEDVEAAMNDLRAKGVKVIQDKPAEIESPLVGKVKYAFIHPSHFHGVLVQLVQEC